ncbi:MAG: PepSY domain-containing protein [Bacteroides sp.]
MNKTNKYTFSLHRIIGTVIALFFLMWFVTGLVLVYHPYPRLSDAQIDGKQETLPDSLPGIHAFAKRVSEPVKNIRVRQFQGQTLVSFVTKDSTYVFCADSLEKPAPITYATIMQIAQHWVPAPVLRVDTLYQRTQWILYSRYEDELPIYRFYFDDAEKHELFVAKRSGEVLQLTDAPSRFWSWVGAIPHKFYFPFIRKNVTVWETSLTIGALFCLIASLTGCYLGLYVLIKRYRNKRKWEIPYKKRSYRLHHLLGLIFGMALIAWSLSGVMSMQRVPRWMVPMKGDYSFRPSKMWGKKPLPLSSYQLDYRKLKTYYPELKAVTWTHYGKTPVYAVVEGGQEHLIDASSSQVQKLFIPEQTVRNGLKRIHGDSVPYRIMLMNRYDNYYLSRDHSLPLPVYKVNLADEDGTVYYISPETGDVRFLNDNKKVKKWLFSGIHYLNIQWLIERPVLWTLAIWVVCGVGAFFSLTGVWLGVRYLRRIMRK